MDPMQRIMLEVAYESFENGMRLLAVMICAFTDFWYSWDRHGQSTRKQDFCVLRMLYWGF